MSPNSDDHRVRAESFERDAQAARDKKAALQAAMEHEKSRVDQTIAAHGQTIERLRANMQVSGESEAQIAQYESQIASEEAAIEQLQSALAREELDTQSKLTQLDKEEETANSQARHYREEQSKAEDQEKRDKINHMAHAASVNDPNSSEQ